MPANSSPPLRRFLGLAGGPRDPPLNIAPILDFGTRARSFQRNRQSEPPRSAYAFGRGRAHTAHATQMAADYNQGFLQLHTLTQNYSWRFPSVATWCTRMRLIVPRRHRTGPRRCHIDERGGIFWNPPAEWNPFNLHQAAFRYRSCPGPASHCGCDCYRRPETQGIIRNPQESFSANENASTSEPVASDGGIPLRRLKHELYARERVPSCLSRGSCSPCWHGPPRRAASRLEQPRNRRPPRAVGMVPHAARSQHRGQS
jgi:hypothetical protein